MKGKITRIHFEELLSSVIILIPPKSSFLSMLKLNYLAIAEFSKSSITVLIIESSNLLSFLRLTSFSSKSSKTIVLNSLITSQHWLLILTILNVVELPTTSDSFDFQKELVFDFSRYSSLIEPILQLCFLFDSSKMLSFVAFFKLWQSFSFCLQRLALCLLRPSSFVAFYPTFSMNLTRFAVNSLLPCPTCDFLRKCYTSATSCCGYQNSISRCGFPRKCFRMISLLIFPKRTESSMSELSLSTSPFKYSFSFLTFSNARNSFSHCLNYRSFFSTSSLSWASSDL